LEEFVSHFENARLDVTGPEPRVGCQFRPCLRFPALANIEFSVGHGATIQEAFAVRYHADIIPLFLQFSHDDEYRTATKEPQTKLLEEWVEKKLLDFLDAYLQIESHEQYQRAGIEIDPVCGMPVAKPVGLTYSYSGKTYYFCTQRCIDRFVAQPEEFISAAD
jgi:YHS domain-containing protein